MDESDSVILPTELVLELYETYQALAEACLVVKGSVRSDQDRYPVYVPTFGFNEEDHVSYDAREAAIKSMTQLFIIDKSESIPEAGIVCASPNTVTAVDQLNTAKVAFKDAVMAIRKFQKQTDTAVSRISTLIRNKVEEDGYRSAALKKAMSTAGITALDLKRCYANIRIMPPSLDVFSWTWATNHTRTQKVSVDQAVEMAKKLSDENSKVALDLLGRCNPGEILVRKTQLANQLRANYAYKEAGKVIRKSCPISGIVIAQQERMPRKLWRENPGKREDLDRLQRESGIEQQAFITSLNLHRYAR
ncbi:hypothetical protein [Microbulbifer sp. THAF38]|uniref:hypothetical protein n=1 Tax=Microbulbifer sp. THAF38 TaxID=2587856 RepID=UPI0012681A22|nr:hypothetical protein [Microbulbifer sp. THAF38]QFT57134.1 hypothetical protein FIU95_21515 [Microbulbifer sp. THAF38]